MSVYYFAYGCNMHLKQMAERCPSSIFTGIGYIAGYRWQINERGVANIVECAGDYVEGIVYEVNARDKRQLDRNEGVTRGFYSDRLLSISLTPLERYKGQKTIHVARELEAWVTARQEGSELEQPVDEDRIEMQTEASPASHDILSQLDGHHRDAPSPDELQGEVLHVDS